MENVYLLVTDLHIALAKDNRYNYFSECISVLEQIIKIGEEWKREIDGDVNLILMGDVFDSSVAGPSDAMMELELFKFLLDKFDNCYAVVGNHELTYQKDNPFWYAVAELEDARLSLLRRAVQPKGLTNYMRIVETLQDGDVVFYFNHYGLRPLVAMVGGVRIGLFHQNVGSNQICKMWGTFEDVEEAAFVQSYDYCFFAHMHLAHGRYELNEKGTCVGEWLGTLGRTKVTEVDNERLMVGVPIVRVQDGRFKGIARAAVQLEPFEKCVDSVSYQVAQRARKELKERKETAQLAFVGRSLKESLANKLDGTPLNVLFNLCLRSQDEMIYEYEQTKKGLLFEEESGRGDEEGRCEDTEED